MNLWHLLWIIPVSVVVIFCGTAVFAGLLEAIKKPKPCERCGHVPGANPGPWKKPS